MFDISHILKVSNIDHFFKEASWYGRVRLSGCNMPESNWEDLYLQAVLEVSGQKIPQRIATTREAIAGRLRNLEHDSDQHMERQKMEKALAALETLEAELRTGSGLFQSS
jgi:hypothetical protein